MATMTIRVRDYNADDPQDAERMAAMFNTWDAVWPGDFTRGVPETTQSVRERMGGRRQLAQYRIRDARWTQRQNRAD